MPRHPDSGQIDLAELFRRVQREMLAQLSVGRMFEHASSAGAATERHWLALFRRYLPQRYRAAPAFVIDAQGHRSRQIDLAIFDNLYSPALFPDVAGLHLPAECVYAVFEIKPTFSRQWIREAMDKAATVRALSRTSVAVIAAGGKRKAIRPKKILAGLLATSSVWSEPTFAKNLSPALLQAPAEARLDLGCSLEHGAFELDPAIRISPAEDALFFFILRLLDRLRSMGTAPAADLMKYAPTLRKR
jgi:hypothetical protein